MEAPKRNNPILDVMMALVKFFMENVKATYDVEGQPVRHEVPAYIVKEHELVPGLNDSEELTGSVPHVRISLPKIVDAAPGYKQMGNIEFDASQNHLLTRGLVLPQTEVKDFKHKLMLVAENYIVLSSMMADFINAFKDKQATLCVYDRSNNKKLCYDMEVTNWPDGTGAKGNNDAVLAANADIVIHGVQFFSGEICDTPYTILEFQILVHQYDQEVVVDEVGNVTIQPKSGA